MRKGLLLGNLLAVGHESLGRTRDPEITEGQEKRDHHWMALFLRRMAAKANVLREWAVKDIIILT